MVLVLAYIGSSVPVQEVRHGLQAFWTDQVRMVRERSSRRHGEHLRVPENIATSFPEIIATFGAVISGSVTSRLRGAMGLLSARDKEDDQYVGSRADSDTS